MPRYKSLHIVTFDSKNNQNSNPITLLCKLQKNLHNHNIDVMGLIVLVFSTKFHNYYHREGTRTTASPLFPQKMSLNPHIYVYSPVNQIAESKIPDKSNKGAGAQTESAT